MSSKLIIPTDERPDPALRRTSVPADLAPEKMSELGRDLFHLAKEIGEGGELLTSEEELEQELARRRSGYTPNGDS